ncbi:hypothetical protein HDU76_003627 [Blyttiomyces sp. JEL0837]|nr:hypothetical protein HDU76_003627 [Blyttiomyces sp. JEL0837]
MKREHQRRLQWNLDHIQLEDGSVMLISIPTLPLYVEDLRKDKAAVRGGLRSSGILEDADVIVVVEGGGAETGTLGSRADEEHGEESETGRQGRSGDDENEEQAEIENELGRLGGDWYCEKEELQKEESNQNSIVAENQQSSLDLKEPS